MGMEVLLRNYSHYLSRYTKSWRIKYSHRLRRREASTAPIIRDHYHARQGTFRMAIIGSGPAGFYTAQRVLSKMDDSFVDMYERLPVPFGLVRYGVAPDHAEVKNCQEKFTEIASSPRFTFVGNMPIGNGPESFPLHLLLPHYHAILFAYGASQDRKLGIPGEDSLKGIYSARDFVGWYNGLPECADIAPDLTTGEEAIIIGQGNVALDVARILLQHPDALSSTDITENALNTLRKSKVKHVKIIGRRGPLQAAYTTKEIRELTKLSSVEFNPVLDSLVPDENIMKILPRSQRRIMELLQKSSASRENSSISKSRSVSLEYCLAPKSFNCHPSNPSQVGRTTFEKTKLIPSPNDIFARSEGTNEFLDIKSTIALVSIGYKAEALSGFEENGVPFNHDQGVFYNDTFGRVLHGFNSAHVPGMYCSGWVKNGSTGVIAHTLSDAFKTAESIVKDWYDRVPFLPATDQTDEKRGWTAIKRVAAKNGHRPVSWHDWQKIDQVERANGQKNGRSREKFRKVKDMLSILE